MDKTIAELLEDHVQYARNQRCSCGWKPDYSLSAWTIGQQHRNHVATLLTELLAEAWNEGFSAALKEWRARSDVENPYRHVKDQG